MFYCIPCYMWNTHSDTSQHVNLLLWHIQHHIEQENRNHFISNQSAHSQIWARAGISRKNSNAYVGVRSAKLLDRKISPSFADGEESLSLSSLQEKKSAFCSTVRRIVGLCNNNNKDSSTGPCEKMGLSSELGPPLATSQLIFLRREKEREIQSSQSAKRPFMPIEKPLVPILVSRFLSRATLEQ